MTQKLSVVAPVFNEQNLILEFVDQVKNSIKSITSDFEILLVDDGSTDNSWDEISKACKIDKRIRGIKLSKNFGHHFAITAGLHNTDSEWVVVMDSDLQDRPEIIPKLYLKAQEGFDIVFVDRVNRPESFGYRILQKIFYTMLGLLSGLKFNSKQANFSIINKKVVEAFKNFPEQARFYVSTINWLGFNKASIEADHGVRFSGKPSYTLKKRFKLASDVILAFSDRPLQFSIYLGILISLVSFGIIGWILVRLNQVGFTVSGWASLLAAILFIGGVQIFILGIVGIYISKIFSEVKNRPLFVISDKIN